MPHARPFVVHAFEAAYSYTGAVERIIALTVECGPCGTTSSADASLIHLPGGALFRCHNCGSHQAISHARLDARNEMSPQTSSVALL